MGKAMKVLDPVGSAIFGSMGGKEKEEEEADAATEIDDAKADKSKRMAGRFRGERRRRSALNKTPDTAVSGTGGKNLG